MSKSYLNIQSLPRGLRNNNPGNIVFNNNNAWTGKISYQLNKDYNGSPSNIVRHFEQFNEVRYGLRALMRVIISYHNQGKRSVIEIINRYAPAFENNTGQYIATVANMVGIAATAAIPTLDKSTLIGLCKAIVYVENGNGYQGYITEADYNEAFSILGLPIPDQKKKTKQ
ncbi:MAG TPA: hypothetical protein VF581_07715 [Flavobacterium sp.]|jgi:hypothetical protein